MLDADAAHAIQREPQALGPACTSGPMQPSGSRWAVVATYANAEFRAERHLREQHFETYLPTILARRRHRFVPSRTTFSLAPLFPAYLFLAFDPNRPWRPITNTPGVYQLLVDADGHPAMCNHNDLQAVRDALHAAEARAAVRCQESAAPAPGTPVDVANGMSGVVLSTSRSRAIVAVVLLGGLRRVSVPLDQLAPRAT